MEEFEKTGDLLVDLGSDQVKIVNFDELPKNCQVGYLLPLYCLFLNYDTNRKTTLLDFVRNVNE